MLAIVREDEHLTLRTEPYVAFNPKTGEKISVQAFDADTELAGPNGKQPFLRFSGGDLQMKYVPSPGAQRDLARTIVAEVARKLGAIITNEASGEVFDW